MFRSTVWKLSHGVNIAANCENPRQPSEFTSWTNPKLTSDEAFKHWKENDFLMTIGSQGVGSTHANSLREMLQHHAFVKIKLATDKLDAHHISAQLLDMMSDKTGVDVVEIRRRGVLFTSRPLA
eukprot:gene39079-47544_t